MPPSVGVCVIGDDETDEISGKESHQPRSEKQSDQRHGKDGHATKGQ